MGKVIGLREDAATVFFLGVEVYAFGLYVALGLALAMIALTSWKGPWGRCCPPGPCCGLKPAAIP